MSNVELKKKIYNAMTETFHEKKYMHKEGADPRAFVWDYIQVAYQKIKKVIDDA